MEVHDKLVLLDCEGDIAANPSAVDVGAVAHHDSEAGDGFGGESEEVEEAVVDEIMSAPPVHKNH